MFWGGGNVAILMVLRKMPLLLRLLLRLLLSLFLGNHSFIHHSRRDDSGGREGMGVEIQRCSRFPVGYCVLLFDPLHTPLCINGKSENRFFKMTMSTSKPFMSLSYYKQLHLICMLQ